MTTTIINYNYYTYKYFFILVVFRRIYFSLLFYFPATSKTRKLSMLVCVFGSFRLRGIFLYSYLSFFCRSRCCYARQKQTYRRILRYERDAMQCNIYTRNNNERNMTKNIDTINRLLSISLLLLFFLRCSFLLKLFKML